MIDGLLIISIQLTMVGYCVWSISYGCATNHNSEVKIPDWCWIYNICVIGIFPIIFELFCIIFLYNAESIADTSIWTFIIPTIFVSYITFKQLLICFGKIKIIPLAESSQKTENKNN